MPLKTIPLEFPSEVLDMLATTYQDSAGILKEAQNKNPKLLCLLAAKRLLVLWLRPEAALCNG